MSNTSWDEQVCPIQSKLGLKLTLNGTNERLFKIISRIFWLAEPKYPGNDLKKSQICPNWAKFDNHEAGLEKHSGILPFDDLLDWETARVNQTPKGEGESTV